MKEMAYNAFESKTFSFPQKSKRIKTIIIIIIGSPRQVCVSTLPDLRERAKEEKILKRQRIKILPLKQMLQRFPILLPQLKAVNISEKLMNEIRPTNGCVEL